MLGLLTAVVLASLVGSLHCAGMCGGLVAFVTGGAPGSSFRLAQWAYHLSRGASYLILGAIAGGLGAAVDLSGSALGFGRGAVVLAGATMVFYGLFAAFRDLGWLRLRPPASAWFGRLYQRGQQLAATRGPVVRAAWVGALTALLPCGWLYAFVLTAASTASLWGGAVVMAAFWLGTVPILIAFALGVRQLAVPVARRLPRLAPWLLVAVGLFALSGRYDPPSFAARRAVVSVDPLGSTTSPPARDDEPATADRAAPEGM